MALFSFVLNSATTPSNVKLSNVVRISGSSVFFTPSHGSGPGSTPPLLDFETVSAAPVLHREQLQSHGLVAKVCLGLSLSCTPHEISSPEARERIEDVLYSPECRLRLWHRCLSTSALLDEKNDVCVPSFLSQEEWPLLSLEEYEKRRRYYEGRAQCQPVQQSPYCTPILDVHHCQCHVPIPASVWESPSSSAGAALQLCGKGNIPSDGRRSIHPPERSLANSKHQVDDPSPPPSRSAASYSFTIFMCIVWMPFFPVDFIHWSQRQFNTGRWVKEDKLVCMLHHVVTGLHMLQQYLPPSCVGEEGEPRKKSDTRPLERNTHTGGMLLEKQKEVREQASVSRLDLPCGVPVEDKVLASFTNFEMEDILVSEVMEEPRFVLSVSPYTNTDKLHLISRDSSKLLWLPFYPYVSPEQIQCAMEEEATESGSGEGLPAASHTSPSLPPSTSPLIPIRQPSRFVVWALGMMAYQIACGTPALSTQVKRWKKLRRQHPPQLPLPQLQRRATHPSSRESCPSTWYDGGLTPFPFSVLSSSKGTLPVYPLNHPLITPDVIVSYIRRDLQPGQYSPILMHLLGLLLSPDPHTRPSIPSLSLMLPDLNRSMPVLRFPFALGSFDVLSLTDMREDVRWRTAVGQIKKEGEKGRDSGVSAVYYLTHLTAPPLKDVEGERKVTCVVESPSASLLGTEWRTLPPGCGKCSPFWDADNKESPFCVSHEEEMKAMKGEQEETDPEKKRKEEGGGNGHRQPAQDANRGDGKVLFAPSSSSGRTPSWDGEMCFLYPVQSPLLEDREIRRLFYHFFSLPSGVPCAGSSGIASCPFGTTRRGNSLFPSAASACFSGREESTSSGRDLSFEEASDYGLQKAHWRMLFQVCGGFAVRSQREASEAMCGSSAANTRGRSSAAAIVTADGGGHTRGSEETTSKPGFGNRAEQDTMRSLPPPLTPDHVWMLLPRCGIRRPDAVRVFPQVHFTAALPWPSSCTAILQGRGRIQSPVPPIFGGFSSAARTSFSVGSSSPSPARVMEESSSVVGTAPAAFAWILPGERFPLPNGQTFVPAVEGGFVFWFHPLVLPTEKDRYFALTSVRSMTDGYRVPRTVMPEKMMRQDVGGDGWNTSLLPWPLWNKTASTLVHSIATVPTTHTATASVCSLPRSAFTSPRSSRGKDIYSAKQDKVPVLENAPSSAPLPSYSPRGKTLADDALVSRMARNGTVPQAFTPSCTPAAVSSEATAPPLIEVGHGPSPRSISPPPVPPLPLEKPISFSLSSPFCVTASSSYPTGSPSLPHMAAALEGPKQVDGRPFSEANTECGISPSASPSIPLPTATHGRKMAVRTPVEAAGTLASPPSSSPTGVRGTNGSTPLVEKEAAALAPASLFPPPLVSHVAVGYGTAASEALGGEEKDGGVPREPPQEEQTSASDPRNGKMITPTPLRKKAGLPVEVMASVEPNPRDPHLPLPPPDMFASSVNGSERSGMTTLHALRISCSTRRRGRLEEGRSLRRAPLRVKEVDGEPHHYGNSSRCVEDTTIMMVETSGEVPQHDHHKPASHRHEKHHLMPPSPSLPRQPLPGSTSTSTFHPMGGSGKELHDLLFRSHEEEVWLSSLTEEKKEAHPLVEDREVDTMRNTDHTPESAGKGCHDLPSSVYVMYPISQALDPSPRTIVVSSLGEKASNRNTTEVVQDSDGTPYPLRTETTTVPRVQRPAMYLLPPRLSDEEEECHAGDEKKIRPPSHPPPDVASTTMEPTIGTSLDLQRALMAQEVIPPQDRNARAVHHHPGTPPTPTAEREVVRHVSLSVPSVDAGGGVSEREHIAPPQSSLGISFALLGSPPPEMSNVRSASEPLGFSFGSSFPVGVELPFPFHSTDTASVTVASTGSPSSLLPLLQSSLQVFGCWYAADTVEVQMGSLTFWVPSTGEYGICQSPFPLTESLGKAIHIAAATFPVELHNGGEGMAPMYVSFLSNQVPLLCRDHPGVRRQFSRGCLLPQHGLAIFSRQGTLLRVLGFRFALSPSLPSTSVEEFYAYATPSSRNDHPPEEDTRKGCGVDDFLASLPISGEENATREEGEFCIAFRVHAAMGGTRQRFDAQYIDIRVPSIALSWPKRREHASCCKSGQEPSSEHSTAAPPETGSAATDRSYKKEHTQEEEDSRSTRSTPQRSTGLFPFSSRCSTRHNQVAWVSSSAACGDPLALQPGDIGNRQEEEKTRMEDKEQGKEVKRRHRKRSATVSSPTVYEKKGAAGKVYPQSTSRVREASPSAPQSRVRTAGGTSSMREEDTRSLEKGVVVKRGLWEHVDRSDEEGESSTRCSSGAFHAGKEWCGIPEEQRSAAVVRGTQDLRSVTPSSMGFNRVSWWVGFDREEGRAVLGYSMHGPWHPISFVSD